MSRTKSTVDDQPRIRRWFAWATGIPLLRQVVDQLRHNPKEAERFVKFAIVGAIGAVVDFTVLNIMKRLFEAIELGADWNVAMNPHQIQLVAANTISFSVAVLSNFTWNRLWTFPESRERPLGRQLVQFAIVNVLGLGINTIVLLVLDQYVFQNYLNERLSYNVAKAFAIGVVLFWNFGVNRVWTYRGIE